MLVCECAQASTCVCLCVSFYMCSRVCLVIAPCRSITTSLLPIIPCRGTDLWMLILIGVDRQVESGVTVDTRTPRTPVLICKTVGTPRKSRVLQGACGQGRKLIPKQNKSSPHLFSLPCSLFSLHMTSLFFMSLLFTSFDPISLHFFLID